MDHTQSTYAVAVDQSNKYLGTVFRADLNNTSNGDTSDISAHMHSNVKPIHPDTTLETALTIMSLETLAVPVTDSANTFLGMVTPQDLLKILANSQ